MSKHPALERQCPGNRRPNALLIGVAQTTPNVAQTTSDVAQTTLLAHCAGVASCSKGITHIFGTAALCALSSTGTTLPSHRDAYGIFHGFLKRSSLSRNRDFL